MNLKQSIEAVLFSSGKYISVDEIVKLCRSDVKSVTDVLNELKADYESKDSSMTIINEGDRWKLTVREKFVPLVRKIVSETELTKAVMQTLAFIAYKAPLLQSDVVAARSNKAYDHVAELASKGFITKAKKGHTFLINLTQKFFEYFEIESIEEIKKKFQSVAEKGEKKAEEKEQKKEDKAKEGFEESKETKESEDKEKTEETKKEAGSEAKKDAGKEEDIDTDADSESQIDEIKRLEREKAKEKEVKKIEKLFKKINDEDETSEASKLQPQ